MNQCEIVLLDVSMWAWIEVPVNSLASRSDYFSRKFCYCKLGHQSFLVSLECHFTRALFEKLTIRILNSQSLTLLLDHLHTTPSGTSHNTQGEMPAHRNMYSERSGTKLLTLCQ